MAIKGNINRKNKRSLGKKGVALAIALAMAVTMVPVTTMNVNAATYSSSYVSQAVNTFTFTNSKVTASDTSGGNYKIENDTDLTITASGTYVLTGSCSEGSVTVKKGITGVTLVLKNLSLASSEGAPITINKENTDTTIVISGTNTLTDNENPDDEESTDEAVADAFEGAGIKLKSNGSLLITGDGVLNIKGNCKNGIKGADNSTITIGKTATDTFTLNVTAANDGISGDGADGVAGLNIIGGNINVSAADDGIKSDYIVNIGKSGNSKGATINITKSEEGIEGATVNLYSGSATVVSSDDGINAANSDLTDYSYSLNIYGGTWDIDAGGDGLDSNGSITVSGGVTDVSSSTQNDNNAIDWGENSYITVTGGTIIGIGMGGMQQGFTNGNYVFFSANLSKGNTVAIKDASGNTLYETTVKKAANSVIFSSDALTDGGTYTLYVNGTQTATATEGAGAGMGQGGFGPGGQGGMGPNGQGGFGPGGQGGMEPPTGSTPPTGGTQTTDGTQPGIPTQNTNTSTVTTDSEIQGGVGSVFRLYNPYNNEHFYTEDTNEAIALRNAGWTYEGFAFYATSADRGAAVYRLYNPFTSDHHYTTDANEANILAQNGWNNEGVAFYTESSGGTPVYRLFNSFVTTGAHHYTSDYNEYIILISQGWNGEGIAWYTR